MKKKLTADKKQQLVKLLEELINTQIMQHLYGKEWLDEIKVTYKDLTPEERLKKLFDKPKSK